MKPIYIDAARYRRLLPITQTIIDEFLDIYGIDKADVSAMLVQNDSQGISTTLTMLGTPAVMNRWGTDIERLTVVIEDDPFWPSRRVP